MSDWTLVQLIKILRDCIKDCFFPLQANQRLCIFGLAMHIYPSFKDQLEGSKGYVANRNFIQNFTHMYIEYAFGIWK